MFAPDWDEACEGCSFTIDHSDGGVAHLEAEEGARLGEEVARSVLAGPGPPWR